MELEIEKQKHQELIAKYQKDHDDQLHLKVLATKNKLLWDFDKYTGQGRIHLISSCRSNDTMGQLDAV